MTGNTNSPRVNYNASPSSAPCSRSPKSFLLDEATAALDEPTEAMLYRALKQKLPDSIIISIGHRSTLNEFHDLCLDVGHVQC